jgi:2-dehydropantoate 2-reductase
LHSDYAHVAQHGLRIDSHLGDFVLPTVNAHATVDTMPACDVTIVALKTTLNRLLPTLLPAPTRQGGVVLVLQNGLDIEADAAAVVGPERVLGGTCFLCSNKAGPGHIKHLDYGRIVFGNYVGPTSEMTKRIEHQLRAANIDARATDDLLQTRWRKLMWNIPFNGLSVALAASTKELMESQDAVNLIRAIIQEVHAAATAAGVSIDPSMIETTIDSTRTMVPYDSSMRIDYLNRRPLEIEAIFGNPLRAAARLGIAMPRVEMLYQQLKYLEQMACS